MGRILDLGRGYGTWIFPSFSPQADLEALKEDWKAVGQDLAAAYQEFETKIEYESERKRR